MLKNADKSWNESQCTMGKFLKSKMRKKLSRVSQFLHFPKCFLKKKQKNFIHLVSIQNRKKNNANHSKLILLEDDATRFEDFKSDLFSGIQKVLDFE